MGTCLSWRPRSQCEPTFVQVCKTPCNPVKTCHGLARRNITSLKSSRGHKSPVSKTRATSPMGMEMHLTTEPITANYDGWWACLLLFHHHHHHHHHYHHHHHHHHDHDHEACHNRVTRCSFQGHNMGFRILCVRTGRLE